MTSIMGCNSVANLRKTKIYNTNVDLVNDNMYTKFGLNLSILSQDIEQNQILTSIKGRNSVANMRKTMIYNASVDLINDNEYTKFDLNRSIRIQDIEQKLNFSHFKSMGIFPVAHVQLIPQSLIRSGRIRTRTRCYGCPRYLQE